MEAGVAAAIVGFGYTVCFAACAKHPVVVAAVVVVVAVVVAVVVVVADVVVAAIVTVAVADKMSVEVA